MQSLDVYQSLWAMQIRQPAVPERTLDENFSLIAEAGFVGVCLDPGLSEIEEMLALKPYFHQYGLECMMNVFPNEVTELAPLLELARELDARLVNIIGGVMPIEVADAVPLVYRWLDDASRFAFPVLFETHRNGLLNDLFYTLQLIGKVPEMRLCADLSHFVVDRELVLPLQPRDQQYFEQILDRSDSFQGRISSTRTNTGSAGFSATQELGRDFHQLVEVRHATVVSKKPGGRTVDLSLRTRSPELRDYGRRRQRVVRPLARGSRDPKLG